MPKTVEDVVRINARSDNPDDRKEFPFTKTVFESNDDLLDFMQQGDGYLSGKPIFEHVNYSEDLNQRQIVRSAKTPKSASKKYIIEITGEYLANEDQTKLIAFMTSGESDVKMVEYYTDNADTVNAWIISTKGESHVPVIKANTNTSTSSEPVAGPEDF